MVVDLILLPLRLIGCREVSTSNQWLETNNMKRQETTISVCLFSDAKWSVASPSLLVELHKIHTTILAGIMKKQTLVPCSKKTELFRCVCALWNKMKCCITIVGCRFDITTFKEATSQHPINLSFTHFSHIVLKLIESTMNLAMNLSIRSKKKVIELLRCIRVLWWKLNACFFMSSVFVNFCFIEIKR